MRGGAPLVSSFLIAFLCSGQAWGQSPVASTVALTLEPVSPVKGRDAVATLEISIGGLDQPAPPVLRANVGTFENVERVGPGRFRARYVLPTTRFPEVAIIVAFAPWPHPQSVEGAFGVLRVPIASAVEVPGRAEAGAEVRLNVGDQTFGPVTAQAGGTFKLPVVIPPGYGMAKTITVDRVGNKRTSPLDLMLPPTDQLACVVTPTKLPADGVSRARVLCASSDRYGAASKGARIQWKGGRGTWSAPRDLADGVHEWTWTAPREVGSGSERLTATWKQGKVDSSEEISVGLSQGPVRSLVVKPEDSVAHAGGIWRAVATTKDQLGRPLAGVAVQGPGAERAITDERGEATLKWALTAGETLGSRSVLVRATGPLGREPARLLAWRTDGGVMVTVTDLAGLPVPAQRLRVGATEFTTSSEGLAEVPAVGELVHAEWPGLKLQLGADGGVSNERPGVLAQVPVEIGPALPMNVKVAPSGGGVEWWVESPLGEIVDGRAVEISDQRGVRRVVSRGKSQETFHAGLMSITDIESRVCAVVEAGQ
jgi:hypothetical protein